MPTASQPASAPGYVPPAVPRSAPELRCDVVMKGGITSGVVYPYAVAELAATYRLTNVGGTSAGAIAAAVAAAAEYGRARGGYDELASIPRWLGASGNLAGLFQPHRASRRPYALLFAVISRTSPAGKALAGAGTALTRYWLPAAAGLGLGAALVTVAQRSAAGATATWVATGTAALLALLLTALAVTAAVVRSVRRALAAGNFGLCSGMPTEPARRRAPPALRRLLGTTVFAASERAALTPWLHERIQRAAWPDPAAAPRLADGAEAPLTFGHLHRGPAGATPAPAGAPWLRLEMVTTNVTNHAMVPLPALSKQWYFDEAEFRRLFPASVVDWMRANPRPQNAEAIEQGVQAVRRAQLAAQGLHPMPATEDLPVVVATRMSLSFPLLLSAVPLWRTNMGQDAEAQVTAAWRAWVGKEPATWAERYAAGDDLPAGRFTAARCWFSDGGISSNFPVHFFDAYLPGHPTVAINLGRHDPSGSTPRVWMPSTNNEALAPPWYPVDSTTSFLANVVRTMQGRVDEAQMRVPGYRDRIVHVDLSTEEGGLNLDMPESRIDDLTRYGGEAGAMLVRRFAHAPLTPGGLSWDSHRWTRLRTAFTATGDLVHALAEGYDPPPAPGEIPANGAHLSYEQLLTRPPGAPPTSYALSQPGAAKAKALIDGIRSLAGALDAMDGSLAERTPNPPPPLGLRPEDARLTQG